MKAPHSWRKAAAAAASLTLLAAGAAQAQASPASAPEAPAPQQGTPAVSAAAAPAPAAPSPAVTPITQHAVQQGILQCAARINQVSSYLGAGPDTGALLMAPAAPTDQRLFGLAQEVLDPQAGSAYVSAAFAPNQANGCGASYDAVLYWPQACDSVASKQFSSLKKHGALKQAITVLEGSPASRVFLMPAGSGCISIKKEIVL